MAEKTNLWRQHKNGLPQGSVLASTLFNLYTSDLLTQSRKVIYADDICCAVQSRTFEVLENALSADMALLADYC